MPAPSRQPPASSQPKSGPTPPAPVVEAAQAPGNRKKAKRRAKEAAKKAAAVAGHSSADAASPPISPPVQNGQLHVPGAFDQSHLDPQGYVPEDADLDDGFESDPDEVELAAASRAKSKKKRKNRKASDSINGADSYAPDHSLPSIHHPPPPIPPPAPITDNANNVRSTNAYKFNKDRIWNTSTAEERENIKDFWLHLEETERRSLVKVEKEAVLKKMKEQQKHSCSCSVCGRKRTAIEEELEVLYDAYYEELEQYANHSQVIFDDASYMTGPPPPAQYHPPSLASRLPPLVGQNGPQSRFQEEPDLDDDATGEEVYSDDEDGYDDDEYSDEPPPQSAMDFFNFGNSLTVQGGILTVADDLLKNDGKKFIEMMEQLAERRMQREEEAQYAAQGLRHPSFSHNHGPPLEEDDGYDDDEYATDDDEYDEEEEEEAVGYVNAKNRNMTDVQQEGLTEEQRMEEGRRMFQIFAARMFEQRVLNAYREKVARERQEKLLEELEEEENLHADRDAKRANQAAKKKAKKEKLKMEKEKARLDKEREREAAEAQAKAEEARKAEELRVKKEEQKRKKEEEKRKQEEEKLRKEEEKRKKQADARKAQDEAERKLKEQKEKERLKREETKRKEREDRETKEREVKERREIELAEKKDREARLKAEKQSKEQTSKTPQVPKGPAQLAATPAPPQLRKQTSSGPSQANANAHAVAQSSPHLQIATPVIPKIPSPARQRQASQQGSVQGSHQSSPKSSQVPSGSSATSPSTSQQVPAPNGNPQKGHLPPPMLHQAGHIQPQGHHQMAPPPNMAYPGMSNFPPYAPPQGPAAQRFPPGFDQPAMQGHHFGAPFRGYPGPNGPQQIPGQHLPPGLNVMRPIGTGPPAVSPNSATSPLPPTGAFGHPPVPAPVGQRPQPHSRQASASFDKATDSTPAQPIGPPQHSKRPSSSEIPGSDEWGSAALGSSALLGDDVPEEPARDVPGRGGPPAPFVPVSASGPLFQRPFGHSPFGTPQMNNFAHSPVSPWQPTSNAPGSWGAAKDPFMGPHARQHNPVMLRQLICQAARNLSSSPHTQSSSRNGGFHDLHAITREVNLLARMADQRIQPKDLLDLCDTIGNAQNGGGSLTLLGNDNEGYWVKFEDDGIPAPTGRGSIGDIGSPMPGGHQPAQSPGGFMSFGGPAPQRGGFGQPMRGGFGS